MSLVSNLVTAFTAIGNAVRDAKIRSNHTGTQLSSTISDFTEASQDAVGSALDATLTYNDGTNSIGRAAVSGDVTIAAGSNTSAIATGVIVNADINASAAIALSKLAPITGYTSGAGVVAATDSVLQAIQKLNGNTTALTTTSVAEGTNLYYTNARAIASVLTSYASGAGVISATDTILQAIQKLNGNVAALTTTNVAEGTNLYYTNTRGIGSTLAGFTAGAGTITSADTILSAIQKLTGNFNTATTSVVPEGTNLYYTNARGIGSVLTGFTSGPGTVSAADTVIAALQKINGNVTGLSTSNVTEGSNLYFTNARAIAAPLTSLSTTTASAAVATDTILQAIGKLEARTPKAVVLTSAFATTSSTLANITGWTISVTSGSAYLIEVVANYQSAATTTGGRIGIAVVTATGTVAGFVEGAIVTTTAATQLFGTLSSTTSNVVTSGTGTINTPCAIYMKFVFNCTATGTLNLQWASEINGSSARLNIGSTMIYNRLN